MGNRRNIWSRKKTLGQKQSEREYAAEVAEARQDYNHTVISKHGGDLFEYFYRLTSRSFAWKWIRAAPGESWAGDWIVDDAPCFLLYAKQLPDGLCKHQGVSTGTCYMVATGNDDLAMYSRDLTRMQALDLFDAIEDSPRGMKRIDLEQMGFDYE